MMDGTARIDRAIMERFKLMNTTSRRSLLAMAFVGALALMTARAQQAPAQKSAEAPGPAGSVTVEISNSKDLLAYFEKIGYTPKAWQAGIREIPRVYIADIPSQWRQKGSKELPTVDKKRIFFRVITPIILRVNEMVMADRTRAMPIAEQLIAGGQVSAEDDEWFRQLATRYGTLGFPDDRLDAVRIEETLRRVDIVPPSLALAQAASESGWGTSRFADEGNSLFGQWSWSEGIVPAGQRSESRGDHRVAAFESTGASVLAYVRNLNTHPTYQDFRRKREDLRKRNLPLRGADLVETLIGYSERGQAYIEDLKTLMRQNRLDATDDAFLWKRGVVFLVPKGSPER
jgi:Bax protein